jgi:hypothetical protein
MHRIKSLSDRLTAEAIAVHEQAIDGYTQALSDLIPKHGSDPLIDILINHYAAIIRILIQEWKEMKAK